MPLGVAFSRSPYSCDASEPGSRNVKAHSEQPEIINRVVAGPARANGSFKLASIHSGGIVRYRYSSVRGIRRGYGNAYFRASHLMAAPLGVDKCVHRIVDKLRETFPLSEIDLAQHGENARIWLK